MSRNADGIQPKHSTIQPTLRIDAKAIIAIGLALAATSSLAAPVEGCGDKAKQGFGERFASTYQEHLGWNGADPQAPASTYRGVPPAVSSPPFPFTNWPLGGTENIGYENQYGGPLMDTFYCGDEGQAIKDSRITVYGWMNIGGNWSTSKSKFNHATGTGGNYPAAYSYQPNTVQLDQLALYVERTPDVLQKDHIDWGFRIAGLYGTDYKYTFAHKVDPASKQYEKYGQTYGFDAVMAYGELYFPQFADGLNVRVGRYISIPDIEAQLAPNNYTYSHSLLYTYDPYTQEGVVASLKLSKNWLVQGELSAGNDIAIWDKQNRKLTPAVCVAWTADSGDDMLYPCINGLNSGKFAWNNVQHMAMTWYHKFNDRLHIATEGWYMWQRGVPNVNNTDPNVGGAAQLATLFPNTKFGTPSGAQCSDANAATCRAAAYALLNYIEYQLGPRDSMTIRNEIFNDQQGQRTGFKTLYSEHLIGWSHWVGDTITLRPELRFERSYSAKAFDNPTGTPNGGKNKQLMLAADVIVHF